MLMILPPPTAFMAGYTACEHKNALVRLVLITLSHSASSSACGALRILMPALLTRMSIRPSSRNVRSTMAVTAALSVTSATTDIVLTPCPPSSATAASDFVSLRPTIATLAPASASPRAMPRPMPPLPPVTIATLPPRSNSFDVIVIIQDAVRDRSESARLALALPDQNQSDHGQRRAVIGPLDLADHEARLRPFDHAGALTDPEQPNGEREPANGQQQFAHGFFLRWHWPRVYRAAIARVARPLIRNKSGFGVSDLAMSSFAQGTKKPRTMPGPLSCWMSAEISTSRPRDHPS